ncbi:MAG: hypothetical protein IKK11_05300 [Oscillospiraceae bacterium]|nr:hypothetical protein [Oscillospiraceae bacterium]
MEKSLDFEKRMLQVHKPNRVNPAALESVEGVRITPEWKIVYPAASDIVLVNGAKDLQDYFQVSMNVDLALETAEESGEKTIFITTDNSLQPRSFRIQVSDRIVITGVDPRYTAQGGYALEDILNMNEAPVISPRDETKQMRFSMRTINGGMHDEHYPDAHLQQIAHAGMTAVDLYLLDAATNPETAARINDIITRAAKFGLDVYGFPHFYNTVHPDEPGAFAHYDGMYGKLMETLPGLKGLLIVGECCEFPSKDERTTGKRWVDSINDEKTSPGWFPCRDYPEFVSLLRDVVHSHAPEAEVVFWTYNWGYEQQELREELLRNVPLDIPMMATFEMFEEYNISPEIQEFTTDYSLWKIGPGKYYASEAAIARERGLKMYCMANTGGNTWDIGGVPYLPAPQRWIQRWQAVANTQDTLKMDGTRESHSYGFWPSFLPEMAKYAYMTPATDLNELLEKIIVRDFGKENLETVLAAFGHFSEGMSHCVSTCEDQYGPARVGPSYPLFFVRWERIPNCPVTGKSVNEEGFPVYTYNLDRIEKLRYETAEYQEMARQFALGCDLLAPVVENLPENKKADALHILQVATYIRNNAITIHHTKRWHDLKGMLGIYVDAYPTWAGGRKNAPDTKKAEKPLIPVEDKRPVVEELLEIIHAEIENAKDTIPLVEANSRLGYEKEYGYSCCKEQLLWKIQMAERTIAEELLPLLEKI